MESAPGNLLITSVDQYLYSQMFDPGARDGQYVYRGHADEDWTLLPSLFRGRSRYEAILFQRALFKDFLMGKTIPFLKTNDPVELFTIFQHFGIPTRLLDLTFDPLVALFFACYDPENHHTNKDGKLFIFLHRHYKSIEINTSQQQENLKPITPENIDQRIITRLQLPEHRFLNPFTKNARQRAQNGCFLYFSTFHDRINRNDFLSLEQYHKVCNDHVRKTYPADEQAKHLFWFAPVKVPKSSKPEILNELDYKYGINKDTMFPRTKWLQEVEGFFEDYQQGSLQYLEELKQSVPYNPDTDYLI